MGSSDLVACGGCLISGDCGLWHCRGVGLCLGGCLGCCWDLFRLTYFRVWVC